MMMKKVKARKNRTSTVPKTFPCQQRPPLAVVVQVADRAVAVVKAVVATVAAVDVAAGVVPAVVAIRAAAETAKPGPLMTYPQKCHPERSEGSRQFVQPQMPGFLSYH